MRYMCLGLLFIGLPGLCLSDAPINHGDPNVLAREVWVGSTCPINKAEANEVVDGVLIRARLKPDEYYDSSQTMGFFVSVRCMRRQGTDLFIYKVDVNFVQFAPIANRTLQWVNGYGSMGIGLKVDIRGAIRDGTERLVTDYIKVNFNLGSD